MQLDLLDWLRWWRGGLEYLLIIAAILLVDLLALVSPGPNFVLITSAAVSKSRTQAIWTAFGIACGSLFWASAAALGIAAVFESLPLLGLMLKIAGIAYLIYLGTKLLRSSGIDSLPSSKNARRDDHQSFWTGFLVNITNPKSAAYYASVFAALLTPDLPLWVLIVLVVSIAAMSLIWHGLLAVVLSNPSVQSKYVLVSKTVDRICGSFLIFLGIKLAWDSRPSAFSG